MPPKASVPAHVRRRNSPGSGFWTLWVISTFGPILAYVVLAAHHISGNGMGWLLFIAVPVLIVNLMGAFVSSGYQDPFLGAPWYRIAWFINLVTALCLMVVGIGVVIAVYAALQATSHQSR